MYNPILLTFKNCLGTGVTLLLWVFSIISSCKPYERDRQIKMDISTKAKNNLSFAGINFSVRNDTVILTGMCPTPEARDEVIRTIKTIYIVAHVADKIKISPVHLGSNLTVKNAVDSVLANYPLVNAVLTDSSLVLTGQLKTEESLQLKAALNKISTGEIVNQLTIIESK